ncbi:hypothetical protein [Pyxidicoccus xibeiensis]|uniref:hypothetical protein n=1 Tax=Pyxidicoccus xibeiensis TaxID=2906759 RepID=UPI0020A72E1B|nr:hypothetical protein [Pyxidicoccus xibeiensis]MCP3136932.1 hypothetical protein [Pyxidicoccus xibeiensis]
MGLFDNRIWLREARRRALFVGSFGLFRSWMRPVVELEALREEKDLESLDVLFSFGRYERVLALIDSAGAGLPARELTVRKAACLCLLDRDEEARRTLVEASSRRGDALLTLAMGWLAKLRGWKDVVLPLDLSEGAGDFDWILAARFSEEPSRLDAERAARWGRANRLFEEDRALVEAPIPEVEVFARYFPHDPVLALWTAAVTARGGTLSAEAVAIATREWPELWCVLAVDPLFRPSVMPPRPAEPVLPALLSETMQLWNVVSVLPDPSEDVIPLGDYCPEPYDFDSHGLFTLEDSKGWLSMFESRERAPPFRITVGQQPDRFLGRYDTDVLEPLRTLAPHSGDAWFFLRDVNLDFADELSLRGGRYGFRRWSLEGMESDPDGPSVLRIHVLLRQLGQRPEARFHSVEFQRALRSLG